MSEFNINTETIMHSISKGNITLAQTVQAIVDYINQEPEKEYDIAIGTDSMTYTNTTFTLAITVHRLHNGGIFFYKRMDHKAVKNLRLKLEEETQVSVDAASVVIELLKEHNIDLATSGNVNFHIHMDIGKNGPTRELIQELEGWISALGYDYEIKPDSYAASYIADKYSK